jgi:hypothetical protein
LKHPTYAQSAAKTFRGVRWRVPNAARITIQVGGKMPVFTMPWICRTRGFNYEEFVREEFGSAPKPAGVKIIWWIAAIVLSVVFAVIYFYVAH